MLFSIIIPTYNSEKTIEACLDSILSQLFFDFEVLIMDGMSSDKTLNIVNSYQDKCIKIYSEKDKNVYDAMNKGIKYATGDWLYFLGSDDEFYHNKVLSNIADYILNKESDLIYGNAYFIHKKYFHDGEFDRVKLFNQKNICHQAIFYKKNVFDRLGNYNINFPINADWDFNLRCFATPDLKINYIDEVVVKYNDLDGISSSGVSQDSNFHAVSGAKLNQMIALQAEHIKNIENSKNYKVGSFILAPFRLIQNLIWSIKK